MFAHEAGHILNAVCSGGRVEEVVLHPLAFSRTDVEPNPYPLFVVWGGPVWGIVIPLACWQIVRLARRTWAYLARFYVGMCLVVNGCYIGIGWTMDAGDAGVMRLMGTPTWAMLLFGFVCGSMGLWVWHGLGRRFAKGTASEAVGVTTVGGLLVMIGLVV